MKNKAICFLYILITSFTVLKAQTQSISAVDFKKTINDIFKLLPNTWAVTSDSSFTNEMIIYSRPMDLKGNMTSNDPLFLKGECQIYIKMLPRVSPDSIQDVRKRNQSLLEHLSPQNSKEQLAKWVQENGELLKTIDSEPTHYNNEYSFRIKCYRTPKEEVDLKSYQNLILKLNTLFVKYKD